jgi:hypothetical protein
VLVNAKWPANKSVRQPAADSGMGTASAALCALPPLLLLLGSLAALARAGVSPGVSPLIATWDQARVGSIVNSIYA